MNTNKRDQTARPAAGGQRVDLTKLKLRRDSDVPKRKHYPGVGNSMPPPQVSNGPVDKVVDLSFNPTRNKIREVTIVDRMQARLFPIVDTMNALYMHCLEIASYRQDPEMYAAVFDKEVGEKPQDPNLLDEMLFRIAQWQKSVGGRNLEKATDIALAEIEGSQGLDEAGPGHGSGYED